MPGPQLALDLLQPPQPSLDNFVAGRNAEALARLRALADGGSEHRLIYLWGSAGCGRSHLLQALRAAGACWWDPRAPADAAGVSLVDGVERLDDAAQVALFNRVNALRVQPGIALVASGAAAPAQLALREDLRTRLAWGLVYQLQPLNDAEKASALHAQARARGLKVDDEVIAWLLARLPRDMRTLAAALDALDALALERKKPLTLALLRSWVAAGGP